MQEQLFKKQSAPAQSYGAAILSVQRGPRTKDPKKKIASARRKSAREPKEKECRVALAVFSTLEWSEWRVESGEWSSTRPLLGST